MAPLSAKKAEKKKHTGKPKEYSSGLKVGSDASADFFSFTEVFHPFAEKTPGAKDMREVGFITADPNGNGLCSLAELETFVLKTLVTKYPRRGKGRDMVERGRDLFDAFRPCYIRAFTDAKDYEKDTGEEIENTKKATADDFVSQREFRLFCAYLCIYAAMYDAFAKVDGGGVGRDANDDRRIDLKEMEAGYKGVTGYGFKAFEGMEKKKDAKAVFEAMDDNGGGIVLLDEWCEFLKQAEIEAGTPLGDILAEDEAGGVGKDFTLASSQGPSIAVGRVSSQKKQKKTAPSYAKQTEDSSRKIKGAPSSSDAESAAPPSITPPPNSSPPKMKSYLNSPSYMRKTEDSSRKIKQAAAKQETPTPKTTTTAPTSARGPHASSSPGTTPPAPSQPAYLSPTSSSTSRDMWKDTTKKPKRDIESDCGVPLGIKI
jgi:hypothetical protein